VAFKYRLYTEDGEDIGTAEFATSAWQIGDAFCNLDGHRFDIVNIVPFGR
jgi:hypothetical protein